MIKCCEDHEIQYQRDVIDGAGISVATRYVHGPNAVVNMDDVKASIDLLSKYVNVEFTF